MAETLLCRQLAALRADRWLLLDRRLLVDLRLWRLLLELRLLELRLLELWLLELWLLELRLLLSDTLSDSRLPVRL